ncbi:hypothetical protein WMY93_004014 [Mugilogobius chulae]|uniref:Reverse transcriptase/retrotransposon-derived protein RNase H-like domain-containing protein n=1 Tax=Mugilogobius chulae TaxID=88201 RepID=A0AAW0PYP7_9GOBI
MYGSPEAIESALFSRVEAFPKVQSRDSHKLQELADLLQELEIAKQNSKLCGLAYLDTARGVQPIVEKLPYPLQERWMSKGSKYKKDYGVPFPPFSFFKEFICTEAEWDGVSLNDVLLQGPDLNNSLLGVLMRFRTGPIGVLADIEQMFHCFVVREDCRDVLRFCAPVTIKGRMILRDITSDNVEWDAPLPQSKFEEWRRWQESLSVLKDLHIPRTYATFPVTQAKTTELCVFSDASVRAISAVAYLRVTHDDDHHEVGFVLGKAKLAPQPELTIPRLELCAAVLQWKLLKPSCRKSI